MKTNTILLVLLGLLVVMAGVQAFQLNALAQVISSGAVSAGSSATTGSGVLSQLPTQVGGCG